MHVQQASRNAVPLATGKSAVGQVAHVAAHAAVVAAVFAAVERLVGRVRTYLLEDAAQDGVGQALGLVGAVVCACGWRIEVIVRERCALLGALVAAESFEEAHDTAL